MLFNSYIFFYIFCWCVVNTLLCKSWGWIWLVGWALGPIFNARKKLKWRRSGDIMCDGCDGWRRKMMLTVLQVFFMHEVLGGYCVWVFERISDFLFCRMFCDGYLIMANFSWRQKRHFFVFCCWQVFVLVSPRWLWERCLCLLLSLSLYV